MFLKKEKFVFTSQEVEKDTFFVVSFTGHEGLSQLYKFDINLVSETSELDIEKILKNRVKFSIKRKDGSEVKFNGVLASFEQLHQVDNYTFYKATLVPKIWHLTLTYHNQVFLNKSPLELIESILKDGGLSSNDYEIKFQKEYPTYEFICQFNETHFNFLSRWLEREGIYYYFDQTGDTEKIIFTDTKISHTTHSSGDTFYYSPPSGLDHEKREEIIQSFICKYNNIPQRVLLRDYNFMKPSLEITGSALVDKEGVGEVYYYGEHFLTPEEGNRLAKIRAEQILCTKKEFIGDSTIPYVAPGYLFKLDNHYREDLNQKYLTVEVRHEGAQGAYLISGLSKDLSEREKRVYYQNNFKAIPAHVQFRAEKNTPTPKIVGTINAKIDAEGSGKYAELDEHGRYKIILPFDLSGRKDGKASTWIRMITPYAGSNYGMHFPLHKGTEVLISFIEGNPDRPVIAGAVPNPQNPSQVIADNQTMSKITTAGGNKIHMQDKEGKQNLILQSPVKNTFVRLGAKADNEEKSDPSKTTEEGSSPPEGGEEGIYVLTKGKMTVKGGYKEEMFMGDVTEITLGSKTDIIGLNETKIVLVSDFVTTLGSSINVKVGSHKTYKSLKMAFIPIYNLVAGTVDKFFGTHFAVISEETKTSMEKNTITENWNMIANMVLDLQDELTGLRNQVTTLIQENNTLQNTVNRLQNEVTELNNAQTTIRNEYTQISNAQTTLTSEVNEIKENQNKIVGEVNNLNGEVNHLNENFNVITAILNIM